MLNRNDKCSCGSNLKYKACCGALAAAATVNTPPSPSRLMVSALTEHEAGRLGDAEALYGAVLEQAPRDPDALHMLGVIEYQSARYWDAFTHIRTALDATDWRFEAMRYNMALVLREMLSGDESVAAVRAGRDPRRPALDSVRARLMTTTDASMVDGASSVSDSRSPRAHVLIVDSSLPRADRDSGSVRIIEIMRLFAGLGCRVTIIPDAVEFDSGYASALRRLGVEVISQSDVSGVAEFLARSSDRFDLIWLSRHRIATAWLPLVRRCHPRALVVFDTVDLHFVREERGAAITGDPEALRRAALARAEEPALACRADVAVTVTNTEKAVLGVAAGVADIRVISNVHRPAASGLPFDERRDIVFIGSYEHPPNVDAVNWFVREVWPLARLRLPRVRVLLVGSGMTASVQTLGSKDVAAVGHIPDLAPLLDRCRLSIAPLRFGAGAKGKISLAQGVGLPVIATSVAIEGMDLVAGRDVLVADSAAEFADAVVLGYTDAVLWASLAGHGLRHVGQHFSPEIAASELDLLVGMACERRQTPALTTRITRSASRRRRALVLLSSAHGGLGAEAMVRGLLDGAARTHPEIDIDLLSIHPGPRWPCPVGATTVLNAVPSAHPPGAWEEHLRAMVEPYDHVAVIAADTLDGYHSLRRSLDVIQVAAIAAASGKRPTLLGFSFTADAAADAADALRAVAIDATLCVRDPRSFERLDRLGIFPLTSVADLAFLMPPAATSNASAAVERWMDSEREARRLVVVVNLSGAALQEAPPDAPSMFQSLAAFLSHLATSRNTSFVLMPHDLCPARSQALDDVTAACRMSERLRIVAPLLAQTLWIPPSAADAKRVVGHADLVITGRLHLAIAALDMGTPVVGVGYQEKFEGLFESFGFDDAVIDARSFAASRLAEIVRRRIDSLGETRARIAHHLPQIREAALSNIHRAFAVASEPDLQ